MPVLNSSIPGDSSEQLSLLITVNSLQWHSGRSRFLHIIRIIPIYIIRNYNTWENPSPRTFPSSWYLLKNEIGFTNFGQSVTLP